MKNNCKECDGDNYTLGYCCNGYQCGCMAQPVTITRCKTCNADGEKDPGIRLKDILPYLEEV
jgi:hypothetical protein